MTAHVVDGGLLAVEMDLQIDTSVGRSNPWWDELWPYRRVLKITAPHSGLEKNHPITTYLTNELIGLGKVRSDIGDPIVVQLVSTIPERWRVLPTENTGGTSQFRVRFRLPSALDADEIADEVYYIYYGNQNLANYPVIGSYVDEPFPLTITTSSEAISYTRPGTDWTDGVSSNRYAKATIEIWAESFQILATQGRDWGIAEVSLDNGDWEQVDLFSSQEQTDQIVYEASDLADGKHVVRYRVSGVKNPAAIDTKVNFTSVTYKKHGLAEDKREEANHRLFWGVGYGGV